MDTTIGTSEAAKILNITQRQVQRLCAAGKLRHSRVGRYLIVSLDDVVKLKQEREKTKGTPD